MANVYLTEVRPLYKTVKQSCNGFSIVKLKYKCTYLGRVIIMSTLRHKKNKKTVLYNYDQL